MQPTNNTARLAGALYVLLGVVGPFCLLYVPNKIIVSGNATATANNVLEHEMLLRMGIVSELAGMVIITFMVMVLYRLFNGVDKMQAMLLVIFGAVVSTPISFIGVVNEIGALSLAHGGGFLSVFDKRQLDAMALFLLGMHGKTILVNEIFWGLWLFPFGLLVMRSGFLPRILGILLIINGFAYLAQSLTGLVVPAYASVVDRIVVIPETGELWMMLWLLIKGAKVQQPTLATA